MVRFSCEKTLLQQAVNAVSRAVAAKSSIPALEGILLETEHGLRLSGYNMQTGIRTEVEADIRESGRIVLEGPSSQLKSNEDVREFYLGLTVEGERKSFRDMKHYRRRKRWLG